jgi:hypothetical protein
MRIKLVLSVAAIALSAGATACWAGSSDLVMQGNTASRAGQLMSLQDNMTTSANLNASQNIGSTQSLVGHTGTNRAFSNALQMSENAWRDEMSAAKGASANKTLSSPQIEALAKSPEVKQALSAGKGKSMQNLENLRSSAMVQPQNNVANLQSNLQLKGD